jgi:hypothetical protein
MPQATALTLLSGYATRFPRATSSRCMSKLPNVNREFQDGVERLLAEYQGLHEWACLLLPNCNTPSDQKEGSMAIGIQSNSFDLLMRNLGRLHPHTAEEVAAAFDECWADAPLDLFTYALSREG